MTDKEISREEGITTVPGKVYNYAQNDQEYTFKTQKPTPPNPPVLENSVTLTYCSMSAYLKKGICFQVLL